MTKFGLVALAIALIVGAVFSLPTILVLNVQYEQKNADTTTYEQFPVTVDPKNKLIVENTEVNEFFDSEHPLLQAAVGNVGSILKNLFAWAAISVADAPWYESLAAADGRLVSIEPGMRKEQVASAFARALGWDAKQKKEFLTTLPYASLPLVEGSFSPGIYMVTKGTSPVATQALINERFSTNILSRYGTTTAQIVPLNQALTIASLIEREAAGPSDMRFVSGIIWNRLFIDMPLQIDATLQYAKANTSATKSWWPTPRPSDRFIKSSYNTYLNKGLPPTPISNPSVASVLAALNPRDTPCLFYFHDSFGGFHCTDTYDEHIALLKKYYGRGK